MSLEHLAQAQSEEGISSKIKDQPNGVVRIGKKGKKKFAFGDDGPVFEVDVVVTWSYWQTKRAEFQEPFPDDPKMVWIPPTKTMAYQQAVVDFCHQLQANSKPPSGFPAVTLAEALEFLAKIEEEYEELKVFFQPKSKTALPSQGSYEARFET